MAITAAEKVLITSGLLNLAYGVLLGYAITVIRVKGAPATPKKVAVAKGSSANWILLKALQAGHLSVSGIQVAYLQPADAQPAFNTGSVDRPSR